MDVKLCLTMYLLGGSPGLVIMVGGSCSKGHGFESQHHTLDGHFSTYICCINFNDFCLKRPKINVKRGRGWPIKNNVPIKCSSY